MTYQEFISKFTVYPSKKEAQAKGFEAHHIIPQDVQKRNEIFDNRCVRLTPADHAWAHILFDRENRTKTSNVFLNQLDLRKKDINEITYEDCLAYNKCRAINIEAVREFFQDEEKASVRNKKLSEAKKGKPGRPKSAETKRKLREDQKNRLWITNGIEIRHIPKSEPIPEGWHRGRDDKKGTVWITDNKTCKQVPKDTPIPEGWKRGMKPKKEN